jgi:Alg9-like mannosyltransferase family
MTKQHRKFTIGYPEKITLVGCILSYLLFLSLVPHQELRFLVPLIFPVVLVLADTINNLNQKRWKSFIVSKKFTLNFNF